MLGALLVVVVALGVLAGALEEGLLVRHAIDSASHHVRAAVGWASDVFSY